MYQGLLDLLYVEISFVNLAFSVSPSFLLLALPMLHKTVIITDSAFFAEHFYNSLCKHSVCPCFDFEIGLQDKTLQSSGFQSSILGVSIFPKTELCVHRFRRNYGFILSSKVTFPDKMDVAILHEEFVEGSALGHQVIFNLYHMSLRVCVAYNML